MILVVILYDIHTSLVHMIISFSREIAKQWTMQLQEKDFPEETVKQVSNLLYKLRTHVAMATRAYTTVSS